MIVTCLRRIDLNTVADAFERYRAGRLIVIIHAWPPYGCMVLLSNIARQSSPRPTYWTLKGSGCEHDMKTYMMA